MSKQVYNGREKPCIPLLMALFVMITSALNPFHLTAQCAEQYVNNGVDTLPHIFEQNGKRTCLPTSALLKTEAIRKERLRKGLATGTNETCEYDILRGQLDQRLVPPHGSWWSRNDTLADDTYSYSFAFYVDTGSVTVSVSGLDISTQPVNTATLWVGNYDDTVWYNGEYGDESGGSSSLSFNFNASESHWVDVYLMVWSWRWDEIQMLVQHDQPDWDFQALPKSLWPGDTALFESPENNIDVWFRLANIGSDLLPCKYFPEYLETGYEVPVHLYAEDNVTCSNYQSESYEDSISVAFCVVDDYELSMGLSGGVPGNHENLVVVIDPDDLFEESTESNNCADLPDVYWHFEEYGYITYFDWENWTGPRFQMSNSDCGIGFTVDLYHLGQTVSTLSTDDWGGFVFYIPQDWNLVKIQTYLEDIPGVYIIRDSASPNNFPLPLSTGYYQPGLNPGWPVALNAFDDWPLAVEDSLFNAGLNARATLSRVQQFMDNEMGSYGIDQIKFTIMHKSYYQVGAGYNGLYRRLRMPIGILPYRYYNRFLQHELGHMIWWQETPTCTHWSDPHHELTNITDSLTALVEGWAHFFSAIVPSIDVNAVARSQNYDSTGVYLDYNIETNNWVPDTAWLDSLGDPTIIIYDGQASEGTVASILFDLYDDTYAEEPYSFRYSLLHDALWSQPACISYDLVSAFRDLGPDFCDFMWEHAFHPDSLKHRGCEPATFVLEQVEVDVLPNQFYVGQNYPNPFNSTTRLEIEIPSAGHLEVSVFNVIGQRLITVPGREVSAGRYSLELDFAACENHRIASGTYFAVVTHGDKVHSVKLSYIK